MDPSTAFRELISKIELFKLDYEVQELLEVNCIIKFLANTGLHL